MRCWGAPIGIIFQQDLFPVLIREWVKEGWFFGIVYQQYYGSRCSGYSGCESKQGNLLFSDILNIRFRQLHSVFIDRNGNAFTFVLQTFCLKYLSVLMSDLIKFPGLNGVCIYRSIYLTTLKGD